jgi:hypothetical protein
MEQQSKSKRVTRIEVLVIVLMCILFLGILPLTCRKSCSFESQMTCGINLSSIGRAMQMYAKDYDAKFPRAGGESSSWGYGIVKWIANDRNAAYGLNPTDGSDGIASITSSFYLLVKYSDVLPKTFLCPGDKGVTELRPDDYNTSGKGLTDFWDFGPDGREHCSFSYHMPYGQYLLTTSSEPGMAVAADPNPWISSPSGDGKGTDLYTQFNPDERGKRKIGNAVTHKEEGQNVLFMDGHTCFEKFSFCAINDDNIYTYWDGGDIRQGGILLPSEPQDRLDSFLVNDHSNPPGPPVFEERNR